MSLVSKLGQEASEAVTRTLRKRTGEKVGREVAATASRKATTQAARTLGRDTLKKSAEKAADKLADTAATAGGDAVNPTLAATLAKIQMAITADGPFKAQVSDQLALAATQATTPAEALKVADLARTLSYKNPINKGGIMAGLNQAIATSSTSDEALSTLKAVVTTRQDVYALFSLDQKNAVTTAAVDKLMRSGDPDQLAPLAIKVVKRPLFGPAPPDFKVKQGQVEKTLEEKIAAIAHYLNAALS